MKDLKFSLDQQLSNKLVNSLKVPLTIDALKPKYFDKGINEEYNVDQEGMLTETQLYNLTFRSLEYALDRNETLEKYVEEDENLYNLAKSAVEAFLSENPKKALEYDPSKGLEKYSFEKQKGIWKAIKKYAKSTLGWLKSIPQRVIEIKSIKLERFLITVNKKPQIIVSNPIKIDDTDLTVNYRVTVKYKLLLLNGRVTFSDKINLPDTDLDVKFFVDKLRYLAQPQFRRLSIVKYILGFKITISISNLINAKIKPISIFNANDYVPNIPWFGKTLVPVPPLSIEAYDSGITFGVDFSLK